MGPYQRTPKKVTRAIKYPGYRGRFSGSDRWRFLGYWTRNTGLWFQIFFMFIPIWGNDPIWLYNIFQMGLVQPPTRTALEFNRWMTCIWPFAFGGHVVGSLEGGTQQPPVGGTGGPRESRRRRKPAIMVTMLWFHVLYIHTVYIIDVNVYPYHPWRWYTLPTFGWFLCKDAIHGLYGLELVFHIHGWYGLEIRASFLTLSWHIRHIFESDFWLRFWLSWLCIWMFPKIMVPPNHPLKNRVFPLIIHHPFWGCSPYLWKHPGCAWYLGTLWNQEWKRLKGSCLDLSTSSLNQTIGVSLALANYPVEV